MRMKYISPAARNAKTAKNDSDNFIGGILQLAPADAASVYLRNFPDKFPAAYDKVGRGELVLNNMCPAATYGPGGCANLCLNYSGRAAMDNVQFARVRKTIDFFQDRKQFDADLNHDLNIIRRAAARQNKTPYARLNGTSDVNWARIWRNNPDINFYDYTKRFELLKLDRLSGSKYSINNVSLTFSGSGDNDDEIERALDMSINVALVFRGKPADLPTQWLGRPVIDGTVHDLRCLDPRRDGGYIIGLCANGRAKKADKDSRFIIDV